jgi:hypothetical protein
MIAMVITYVGVRNDYKCQCDTLNSEYKAVNSKNYHLSYTDMLGYIKSYYEYKTQTKASLSIKAH